MNRIGIVFIVVGIGIAVALFFLLRPKPAESPKAISPSPTVPVNNSSKPVDNKVFDLTIAGGKITVGPKVIRVKKDDTIILNVKSDANEELHVHGYDTSVQLREGEMMTLTFYANTTGRFPFELEGSHTELGAIEVQPK